MAFHQIVGIRSYIYICINPFMDLAKLKSNTLKNSYYNSSFCSKYDDLWNFHLQIKKKPSVLFDSTIRNIYSIYLITSLIPKAIYYLENIHYLVACSSLLLLIVLFFLSVDVVWEVGIIGHKFLRNMVSDTKATLKASWKINPKLCWAFDLSFVTLIC